MQKKHSLTVTSSFPSISTCSQHICGVLFARSWFYIGQTPFQTYSAKALNTRSKPVRAFHINSPQMWCCYYLASNKRNLTEIEMKVFRGFTAGLLAGTRVFPTDRTTRWWHWNRPRSRTRSFLPTSRLYPLNWRRPSCLKPSVTL